MFAVFDLPVILSATIPSKLLSVILKIISAEYIFDTSEGYIGEIIELITAASIYAIDNKIERIDIKVLKNCGFVKPSLRKHINDILEL